MKHWHKLPRKIVDSPFQEVFRLGGALNNLLLLVGGLVHGRGVGTRGF